VEKTCLIGLVDFGIELIRRSFMEIADSSDRNSAAWFEKQKYPNVQGFYNEKLRILQIKKTPRIKEALAK